MTPISSNPLAGASFDRLQDILDRKDAEAIRRSVDFDPAPTNAPVPKDEAAKLAAFAAAKATDPKEAKADAFFEKACATYTFRDENGEAHSARVFPQFRMFGGYSARSPDEQVKMLDEAFLEKTPELAKAIFAARIGKATPDQIALVTQGLIDAGKLSVAPDEDPQHAIRALMWTYGLGIDCAGYVQQEIMACRGLDPTSPKERAKLGFVPKIENESFGGVTTSGKWKTIDPVACKCGDLMLLGPPGGGDPGHTLFVRSNAPLDASWKKDLAAKNDEKVRAFLEGDVRVVTVDSSWGGGALGEGGVARVTWLYDATSKTWATWGTDGKVGLSSASGPYDHPLEGIHRPKGES